MPYSAQSTAGNQLLAGLPQPQRSRLLGRLEPIELKFEEVLYRPGQRMRHVFFPIRSVISLVAPIDGHAGLEVGLVGDEGMAGVTLVLGMELSPTQALVQGAGAAWQMETGAFMKELQRSPPLRQLLNRYLYVTLTQQGRVAACTRFHFVEARLARWLLMTRDRTHADEFRITHAFLSYMLGVRRAGITRAAGTLRERNLIRYNRGVLTIVDRNGLEKAACSCYKALKNDYVRVVGTLLATERN